MKIKKLIKDIKNVFKLPVKQYYIGKLAHGTPYFYPINFNQSILRIKKLELRSSKEYLELCKKQPWNKERNRFKNIPSGRRCKDWIINILGYYFWIEIGFPIMVKEVELGYKWKFDSIRFEWCPSFQIYFFNWQFCIFWKSPDGDDDKYYEQILWYISCNKDINKAKKTWGWVDYKTQKSTWKDDYLIDKMKIRKMKLEKLNKVI